jgi:hypothetical protein
VTPFCAGTAAPAQALQRLTVEAFALAADVGRPQVGVPFHLVVTLRVRERVTRIDNLELPLLAQLELLGDERRITSGPKGSQYVETISVVAHQTGSLVIGAATLQAVDARDGRAKQYSTNGLTLRVDAGTLAPLGRGETFAAAAFRLTVEAMLWIVGTLCAIAVVVLLFRRRSATALPSPAPTTQTPPPPPPPQPALRSEREQMQDALTVLRAERTRGAALRVRSAVWRMVGASDGETLADVLHRSRAVDEPTHTLLRALERAGFTHDADLSPAIDDACDALERYIA